MSIRVFVDGQVVPPEQARISVFDRGFLFGESVYETVGTARGKLFALEEHLDRLARSASRVGIAMPSRETLEDAIRRTVAEAGNTESRVRIIVTAGGAPRPGGRFDPIPEPDGSAQLIVIVQPLNPPAPELYRDGVDVEIVSITRNLASALDPAIKTGNYLNNVLALREARRRRPDAHEAILCSADGHVAEGATSNVFAVIDGVLTTPALDVGILDGVTRAKVLSVARHAGLTVHEGRFSADALRGAREAFLTSAARGVLPITRVDGALLGDGQPGPTTRRLMALYADLVDGKLELRQ